MDDSDIDMMIQDCLDREDKLSPWELGFIQGLSESYPEYGRLTEAQQDKLDKIWSRIT